MKVLIAFLTRRKCPRVAQYVAPQFQKFIWAVKTVDTGNDGGH